MGRERDTIGRRLIKALSDRGIVVGTVRTALLPALYAATSPDAQAGRLYGPSGLGHMGGAPAEQDLFSRLRSVDEARRMWEVSAELVDDRSRA